MYLSISTGRNDAILLPYFLVLALRQVMHIPRTKQTLERGRTWVFGAGILYSSLGHELVVHVDVECEDFFGTVTVSRIPLELRPEKIQHPWNVRFKR